MSDIETVARAFHGLSQQNFRHFGMIERTKPLTEWDECPWAYREAVTLVIERLVEDGYIRLGKRPAPERHADSPAQPPVPETLDESC